MSKHLTDAELAAEYWYTTSQLVNAIENTYPFYNDTHALWYKVEDLEVQQMVIERFASLPSAV